MINFKDETIEMIEEYEVDEYYLYRLNKFGEKKNHVFRHGRDKLGRNTARMAILQPRLRLPRMGRLGNV